MILFKMTNRKNTTKRDTKEIDHCMDERSTHYLLFKVLESRYSFSLIYGMLQT